MTAVHNANEYLPGFLHYNVCKAKDSVSEFGRVSLVFRFFRIRPHVGAENLILANHFLRFRLEQFQDRWLLDPEPTNSVSDVLHPWTRRNQQWGPLYQSYYVQSRKETTLSSNNRAPSPLTPGLLFCFTQDSLKLWQHFKILVNLSGY